MEADIEMLFQNITTLELVAELVLDPEPTLALLRAEMQKHRPAGEEEERGEEETRSTDSAVAAGENGGHDSGCGAAGKQEQPALAAGGGGPVVFVDADDAEDQKLSLNSACSISACVVS